MVLLRMWGTAVLGALFVGVVLMVIGTTTNNQRLEVCGQWFGVCGSIGAMLSLFVLFLGVIWFGP